MLKVSLLLLSGVFAQYTRLPDGQTRISKNGFTDSSFRWYESDYSQNGRDWGSKCATGKAQSPIDITDFPDDPDSMQIVTSANSTFSSFLFRNSPSQVLIMNSGYVNVYWIYSGTYTQKVSEITVQNVLAYMFIQTPAEHTINGVKYPLGLMLGYASALPSGERAAGLIVAVLVKEGRRNPALDQFINEEPMDASYFFPPDGVLDDYYYYTGSFSMPLPDCNEGVVWVISNYIVEAAPDQIAYFQDQFINDLSFSNGAGNARAIQPLNGRTVYHFVPIPSVETSSFLG